MSLAQINQIDVNFHLQKSVKIFDENSADKIQSKNKGIKVSSQMPFGHMTFLTNESSQSLWTFFCFFAWQL